MYQFFIDGVMLPIAPASMDTNINNKNTTITLLNGEEINIVKSAGLSDVSFTALLPNKEYPFTIYEGGSFQNAQYYLDLLERLKLSQKPFLFFVIRTDDSGNVQVALPKTKNPITRLRTTALKRTQNNMVLIVVWRFH